MKLTAPFSCPLGLAPKLLALACDEELEIDEHDPKAEKLQPFGNVVLRLSDSSEIEGFTPILRALGKNEKLEGVLRSVEDETMIDRAVEIIDFCAQRLVEVVLMAINVPIGDEGSYGQNELLDEGVQAAVTELRMCLEVCSEDFLDESDTCFAAGLTICDVAVVSMLWPWISIGGQLPANVQKLVDLVSETFDARGSWTPTMYPISLIALHEQATVRESKPVDLDSLPPWTDPITASSPAQPAALLRGLVHFGVVPAQQGKLVHLLLPLLSAPLPPSWRRLDPQEVKERIGEATSTTGMSTESLLRMPWFENRSRKLVTATHPAERYIQSQMDQATQRAALVDQDLTVTDDTAAWVMLRRTAVNIYIHQAAFVAWRKRHGWPRDWHDLDEVLASIPMDPSGLYEDDDLNAAMQQVPTSLLCNMRTGDVAYRLPAGHRVVQAPGGSREEGRENGRQAPAPSGAVTASVSVKQVRSCESLA